MRSGSDIASLFSLLKIGETFSVCNNFTHRRHIKFSSTVSDLFIFDMILKTLIFRYNHLKRSLNKNATFFNK